jgi:hypothetical protein
MSSARDTDHRRALVECHEAGGVLTASANAPSGSSLRQTVAIHRTASSGARVHVETYLPTEWDMTIETFERELPDLDAALAWLETERGIRWLALVAHAP